MHANERLLVVRARVRACVRGDVDAQGPVPVAASGVRAGARMGAAAAPVHTCDPFTGAVLGIACNKVDLTSRREVPMEEAVE